MYDNNPSCKTQYTRTLFQWTELLRMAAYVMQPNSNNHLLKSSVALHIHSAPSPSNAVLCIC